MRSVSSFCFVRKQGRSALENEEVRRTWYCDWETTQIKRRAAKLTQAQKDYRSERAKNP